MANEDKQTPRFKNQSTSVKRRPSAGDIKNELRQEFRERLKISRRFSQDLSRANLESVICDGKEDMKLRFLQQHKEDLNESLTILDEITKELLEMNEEEIISFYRQEIDINNILEDCNVLCKICGDFIEQNCENNIKSICDTCIVNYFQDVMK